MCWLNDAGIYPDEGFKQEFLERLRYVLGRDYSQARFAKSDADKKRVVGLLKREFGEVSQYHQGAGEGSTRESNLAMRDFLRYGLGDAVLLSLNFYPTDPGGSRFDPT